MLRVGWDDSGQFTNITKNQLESDRNFTWSPRDEWKNYRKALLTFAIGLHYCNSRKAIIFVEC